MPMTNINHMMKLVKSYLDGDIDRAIFELDFDSALNSRYKKMLKEDRDIAEWFYECIVDDAINKSFNLSDKDFLGILREEYVRVKDLIDNGVW